MPSIDDIKVISKEQLEEGHMEYHSGCPCSLTLVQVSVPACVDEWELEDYLSGYLTLSLRIQPTDEFGYFGIRQ